MTEMQMRMLLKELAELRSEIGAAKSEAADKGHTLIILMLAIILLRS